MSKICNTNEHGTLFRLVPWLFSVTGTHIASAWFKAGLTKQTAHRTPMMDTTLGLHSVGKHPSAMLVPVGSRDWSLEHSFGGTVT